MLQINRKVEYALAIVACLHGLPAGLLHSARSIHEVTRIPFDMVTKCLQRLHRAGFCEAVQGKHGGYRLAIDPRSISLGAFMAAIAEPVALAECLADPERAQCVVLQTCGVRVPMARLDRAFRDLLEGMSLADFLEE